VDAKLLLGEVGMVEEKDGDGEDPFSGEQMIGGIFPVDV